MCKRKTLSKIGGKMKVIAKFTYLGSPRCPVLELKRLNNTNYQIYKDGEIIKFFNFQDDSFNEFMAIVKSWQTKREGG
jgi:hypothetical protein